MLFFLTTFHVLGQKSKDENYDKAITGAEKAVKKIVGEQLFYKHFILDSLDSHQFTAMVFAGDITKSVTLGTDSCFSIVYLIVQSKDTIGYVSLYMDREGKPLNDWRDPTSSGKPELILGYKILLENKLKIDFQKAVALGREKGFIEPPYLNAETDFAFAKQDNLSYIKVKYFWSFYQKTKDNSTLFMNIDAETGNIESKRYLRR